MDVSDPLSLLKEVESQSDKDKRDKLIRKLEKQIVQCSEMTVRLVSLLEEKKHWDTEPLTLFDRVFVLIRKSIHLNGNIAKRAYMATTVLFGSHERFKYIRRSPESPSVKLLSHLQSKYPTEINELIEHVKNVKAQAKKREEEKAKALDEQEATRREKEILEKAKEAAKNRVKSEIQKTSEATEHKNETE